MKIYCQNCGLKHEFIGEKNKPSNCDKCSENFSFESHTIWVNEKSTCSNLGTSLGFDRNLLASLIASSYEKDLR